MTGKELNFIEQSAEKNGYRKIDVHDNIFILSSVYKKDNDIFLVTFDPDTNIGRVYKNGIEIV